jgi:hypothetical protein
MGAFSSVASSIDRGAGLAGAVLIGLRRPCWPFYRCWERTGKCSRQGRGEAVFKQLWRPTLRKRTILGCIVYRGVIGTWACFSGFPLG